MKIKIRRGLPLLFMSAGMLLGTNPAMAFGSVGNTVEGICASAGNSISPEFNANLSADCFACHNDGDGGSGAGRTAARGSDATIIDFFCPEQIVERPTCTDADGDGFFAEGADCGTLADFNDNNPDAFPGADEICTDGIDNDGDGLADAADPNAIGCPVDCVDDDGDGYSPDGGTCGPIDCNDGDLAVNPGAVEDCGDGIDNNCNGLVDSADMNAVGCPLDCTDNDGDGFAVEGGTCGPMDCDDNNVAIKPSALEVCDDGIDNNCDNFADAQDNFCRTPGGGDDDDDDEHRDDDEHDDDEHDDEEHDDEGRDDDDRDDKPWWRKRAEDDDDDDDHNSRSRDDDDESGDSRRHRRSSRSSRDRDDD